MTNLERNMVAMRIIKLLGIAGIAILAASFAAARSQRRQEELRRKLNEDLERERWESEGGASHSGPATQSAVTAH
jgi:Ribonuclease G/E